jgi:SNF2 family DNA or RNA helicase
MSRVTYRVGKEVLDLPPETDVTYHCDLGSEARRIYKDIEDDFVAQVRDGMVTAANAMVKLLRLQQVANGIAKTDDGVEQRIDNSKQKLLADTLEDIGGDEPVVVFCRFHADLDAIREGCQALQAGLTEEAKAKGHYQTLELSGRRDELKQWQDGVAQVLAVQLDSGGEGVDLTRARFSIFYSLSFSLGKYDQARSRTIANNNIVLTTQGAQGIGLGTGAGLGPPDQGSDILLDTLVINNTITAPNGITFRGTTVGSLYDGVQVIGNQISTTP